MKAKVTTKETFRHSYSREFGWEISENKPERKVISYSVIVNGEKKSIGVCKIEHHYPDNEYRVFCWVNNNDLEYGRFKTMAESKKFVQGIYSKN